MAFDDQRQTIDPKRPTRGPRGVPLPSVRLTVLWHPDVDRVGEVAQLPVGPTELARHALAFGTIDGGPRRPLETIMVSRTPIRFDIDRLTVTITDTGQSNLEVDRHPLDGPTAFTREQLEHHLVLIEINGGVLLGLHAALPVAAAAARHGMVGDSAAMRTLRRAVDTAAADDGRVLVLGETGSGKELVARAIHAASRRSSGPFLPINCGELRSEHIASTLFGHSRGAFTGAEKQHLGAFRQTDTGTLFLDEVGELPPADQPTLLRALDDGEVKPLGAERPVVVGSRVIAATDADLSARAVDGSFRKALFYRLQGLKVEVPPLRARPDDIPRLLAHQLRQSLAKKDALDRLTAGREQGWSWIDPHIVADLVCRPWPGNVRQLLNFAHSLAARGADLERIDEALVDELYGDRGASSRTSRLSSRPQTWTGGAEPSRGMRVERHARPVRRITGPGSRSSRSVDLEAPGLVGSDGRPYGEAEVLALLRDNGWSVHRAHRSSGIPKTSLGRYAREVLGITPAKHLSPDALRDGLARASFDVQRLAELLNVSPRALRARLRKLRIPFAEPGSASTDPGLMSADLRSASTDPRSALPDPSPSTGEPPPESDDPPPSDRA